MEVENIGLIIEVASILLVVLSALIVSLLYIRKNRKLRQGQELLRTQLEIQEQYFDNIYREIHDNIGQALSLAKLNLNTVESGLPGTASQKIECTKELIGKAIIDLRVLGKSLNSQAIKEGGLSEAISSELSSIAKTGYCHTIFKQDGQPIRLGTQKDIILFRVFQESLNNSIKYFKAKTVIVRLLYEPQCFNLTVSDDGDGFEANKKNPDNDVGRLIRNMHNRATLIGADFELTSIPGKGTTVSINLPLEK